MGTPRSNFDAKYHALWIGLIAVQLSSCLLEFDRRAWGVDRAPALRYDSVTGQLDDTSAILAKEGSRHSARSFLKRSNVPASSTPMSHA
jgi:hypothetical protein